MLGGGRAPGSMGRTGEIDCIRTQRNSRFWLAARRPLARLGHWDGPSTALPAASAPKRRLPSFGELGSLVFRRGHGPDSRGSTRRNSPSRVIAASSSLDPVPRGRVARPSANTGCAQKSHGTRRNNGSPLLPSESSHRGLAAATKFSQLGRREDRGRLTRGPRLAQNGTRVARV